MPLLQQKPLNDDIQSYRRPAMRIKTANNKIVDGNEYHEHHYEGKIPETTISIIEESNAH